MVLKIEDSETGNVQVLDDGTTIADIFHALAWHTKEKARWAESYRRRYVPKRTPKEPALPAPKRPRGRPRKNPPASKLTENHCE